jgi:hypothetical protein
MRPFGINFVESGHFYVEEFAIACWINYCFFLLCCYHSKQCDSLKICVLPVTGTREVHGERDRHISAAAN